jgi:hypothetical protein
MNSDLIKKNIEAQIVLNDQSFSKLWLIGVRYPSSLDIYTLEQNLKMATKIFNYSRMIAIPLSVILFFISIFKIVKMMDFINLNNSAVLIILTITLSINTFLNYRDKLKIENKIYLLKLLARIEQ